MTWLLVVVTNIVAAKGSLKNWINSRETWWDEAKITCACFKGKIMIAVFLPKQVVVTGRVQQAIM